MKKDLQRPHVLGIPSTLGYKHSCPMRLSIFPRTPPKRIFFTSLIHPWFWWLPSWLDQACFAGNMFTAVLVVKLFAFFVE